MNRAIKFFFILPIIALCVGVAFGQPPPGRRDRPPGPPHPPPPGRWWDSPEIAQQLGMTSDQVKKVDDIFQQVRDRLRELNKALRNEEDKMEPLMNAERPDDAKLLPQLDRVAAARAELEKANGRFLLSIRHVLTVDQWKKLQNEEIGQQGPPGRRPDQKQHEEEQ